MTLKAWFSPRIARCWLREVWHPWVARQPPGAPFLLVTDNLHCQTTQEWLQTLAGARTQAHLGPPRFTHCWQTVDRGIGQVVKRCICRAQMDFCSSVAVASGWSSLSAQQRRLLMSEWLGDAWESLHKHPTMWQSVVSMSGLGFCEDSPGSWLKAHPHSARSWRYVPTMRALRLTWTFWTRCSLRILSPTPTCR